MRHRKRGRKLKRTASHRRATLAALSVSLLRYKKITTTVAKAKETCRVVAKLITRAKRAYLREQDGSPKDVHARREVFRFLRDREVLKTLFTDVAGKVSNRPGGYTRIVKLGQRHGDGAELAVVQLVDFGVGEPTPSQKSEKEKKKLKKEKRKGKEAEGHAQKEREGAKKSATGSS